VTAPPGRLAGIEGNLVKMGALRLLFWTFLMSGVVTPFFREWGRLSFTQIFLLQSWFMLMNFLLEVPTGAVADRFGRKASVAAGCFLMAAASLVYGSVPMLGVFVLGEAVFAAALTLVSGADEALVYDSLKALGREGEATRVIARLEAMKLTGIFGGALLGSLVASRLGVRAPMLLQALPMALSGVVALRLVEPPRSSTAAPRTAGYLRLLSGGLEHFRHEPELRALTVDQVANVSVTWMVLWLYQPQLMRVGVPLAAFGAVHAAMGLGQVLLLARLAAVERAVGGSVRLLRLTAFIPALAMLALAATTGAGASIALIVLAATAGMGRPPLFSAALNSRIPSEKRATVLSAVSASRTLVIGLLYPVVGATLDRSLPATLVLIGVLGLAAALFASAPARALAPLVSASAPGSGATSDAGPGGAPRAGG
jgi:MFS family permease